MTGYAPSLPFDDPRHLAAHRFLVEEAAILDGRDWARWLDLLTDDVRYVMPVRVTTVVDAGYDARADMAHFDEDRYALGQTGRSPAHRVRLDRGPAVTHPAPRHQRPDVRRRPRRRGAAVESTVLLFRSRGDDREPEYVCASRRDVLRSAGERHLLASREITVDEAVLRTQNLAIFL